MRSTVEVRGAREHNLRNITVEIPRDKLVIITGLSGSGKSSLAFDTIYAEAQRRLLDSLSSFTRRFVDQLKKPDVDFIYGLSPVVSIEQKTVGKNPRSTVGTLTDISDYLRLLYSTSGTAHCPYCCAEIPVVKDAHMVERILALPEGTRVELCAPIFKVYGEDLEYLFAEVRNHGCRRVRINGELKDISEEIDLDEREDYDLRAVIDRFAVKRGIEKQLLVSVENARKLGEGFLQFRILAGDDTQQDLPAFYEGFACPSHGITMGSILPFYFSFNEPESACPTCSGLGTYLKVHPDLLVPDRSRSIIADAFVKEAFRYDKNTWGGRIMYSLSQHFSFPLDVPFAELSPEAVDVIFYGTKGEKFEMLIPEGAKTGDRHAGRLFRFDGVINDLERKYRNYRKQQVAHSGMEEYLRRVMVERTCPDCNGAKLKKLHLLTTLKGRNIYEVGQWPISDLREFLRELPATHDGASEQIAKELNSRLDLLLGIGLDYLSLNRLSMTLSGGESQRIRLSTQIGSGLMGMLYVLDEPSIGLHPKDTVKLVATLRRLRDIGNSVIVVEHDEDTIRAADHIVEIGPGPGVHGGKVVAQGSLQQILKHPTSPTGAYLSGRKSIPIPEKRRTSKGGELVIRGARENNLRNIDVTIPLGQFVCVTGASGSGKSTLVNEILYKRLFAHFYDSRVMSGDHDTLEGIANITDVINIDQSPIGRSPRSNPATYIGFYDDIRRMFAELPESRARDYTAGRFSFNVAGGRCEQCAGDGTVTTHLHFMPDVEVPCPGCKGARYNAETLEILFEGKSITDVLQMTVEEAPRFFPQKSIVHKLSVMNELGLGYLTLGQSATTLSGGEAQRVKLARELGKVKRGQHSLYILDEPTTGLHLADIQRLLECLNRLVDSGSSVLVIEHHLDVIKTADHIIDLGPDGGRGGGELIASGTPDQIMACDRSYTGQYLRSHLS